MTTKVTENGVLIPPGLLVGLDEVEIRREGDRIVVERALAIDPILELGKHPLACGVRDGSERHDAYLSDPKP